MPRPKKKTKRASGGIAFEKSRKKYKVTYKGEYVGRYNTKAEAEEALYNYIHRPEIEPSSATFKDVYKDWYTNQLSKIATEKKEDPFDVEKTSAFKGYHAAYNNFATLHNKKYVDLKIKDFDVEMQKKNHAMQRKMKSGLSCCVNSGNVYGEYDAAGFAGSILDSLCDNCYTVGEVYAKRPGNFTFEFRGSFRDLSGCCFVGEEGDTADYYGEVEASYEEYLNSLPKDPSGMGQIVDDFRVWVVKEEQLKTIDTESIYYKHYGYYKNFVIDMGNENNGYILPKSLQSRTVAPSITNVEYEKSSETRNTFTVTVTGRPAMIQFIEPTDGTRTYDRNHKNVTIKSYDADGNEVNSLDRTAAYEVWSIYSNMMTNVEIRTRAKYLSNAIYTWDSETYDFLMILANPIVSMELSAVEGEKGPVPATVIADDKTEKVMFKMSVNFLKVKNRSTARALMKHCDKTERIKNNHSNGDIDKVETNNNLQLYNESLDESMNRFTSRISMLDSSTNGNKRKDRIELFSLNVPIPHGIPEREFFYEVCKAFKNDYGEQNVINMYLHTDEQHTYIYSSSLTTRTSLCHIHAFVVPEINGTINGRLFSSKSRMQSVNKALDNFCRKTYGIPFLTGKLYLK